MKKILSLAAVGLVAGLAAPSANAGTLDDVRAKGYIQCGITTGLQGFGFTDDAGKWKGFDVDLCQAVAAAVFGDKTKVRYTPTTGRTRFTALSSGEIDVLTRNSTWTYSRDTDLKLDFVGVNYYDGQGFMVPKSLGVKSAKELDGASVCINTGTTTELNTADFFSANGMKYKTVPHESTEEGRTNYLAGRCDVYTTDMSGLAAQRSTFENPDDYVILPEVVSKEPLGPVVRHGDSQWGDVVRWTLLAMLNAEEMGLTSENIDSIKASTDRKDIQRFVGTLDNLGAMTGLSQDWAYNIVKQVGNYGESFERYLGKSTPLGLDRGYNALWTDGGLMYPVPIR